MSIQGFFVCARYLTEAGALSHLPTMPFPPPTSTRMLLGLYEALPSLVETRFGAAKASKSLLFSPTEVTTISTSTGVPVRAPTMRMRVR